VLNVRKLIGTHENQKCRRHFKKNQPDYDFVAENANLFMGQTPLKTDKVV
jgi:hypothetical protein